MFTRIVPAEVGSKLEPDCLKDSILHGAAVSGGPLGSSRIRARLSVTTGNHDSSIAMNCWF